MQMGPVVPMVWEGLNVVKTGRVMLGETNPADSKPGTIRGDFCIQTGRYALFDSLKTRLQSIFFWVIFGVKIVFNSVVDNRQTLERDIDFVLSFSVTYCLLFQWFDVS